MAMKEADAMMNKTASASKTDLELDAIRQMFKGSKHCSRAMKAAALPTVSILPEAKALVNTRPAMRQRMVCTP